MGIGRKTADRGRKLCWCAVLCSLLLCACAQGQRTPAESAAAQPMSDTGDAQDTKEIEAQESAAAQETRSTPDLSGAENADEVLIYLPGTPMDSLPEEITFWLLAHLYTDMPEELPFYVLCNVSEEYAFVGYGE